MQGFTRLSISDTVSQRHARSSAVVYGVAGLSFILFILLMFSLQPSFLLYAAAAAFFMLGLVLCLLRNPLGILTMRAQKKMAAREFVFTPQGLAVSKLSGEEVSFDKPLAELIFLPGPGGCDYYLLAQGENGKSGTFYVGNNLDEVARLAALLEQGGALARYEKPPAPDAAAFIKGHKDRFFD